MTGVQTCALPIYGPQTIGALANQADALACPENYDPDGDGKPDAVCAGGATGAGFYGAGLVDALDAVR